jgi:RHH-type proline utilization regulon transcriptional repressor/proline dehydrogenase/delta 1-pyrroline-5-carboxylate dehydrogenase
MEPARRLADWLQASGRASLADRIKGVMNASLLGCRHELPGPVGESNVYEIVPRGRVLCRPASETGLLLQLGSVLASGNRAVLAPAALHAAILAKLPPEVSRHIEWRHENAGIDDCQAVLLEGDDGAAITLARRLASSSGPIIPLLVRSTDELAGGGDYPVWRLATERSISTNTAASGNTSLAVIG